MEASSSLISGEGALFPPCRRGAPRAEAARAGCGVQCACRCVSCDLFGIVEGLTTWFIQWKGIVLITDARGGAAVRCKGRLALRAGEHGWAQWQCRECERSGECRQRLEYELSRSGGRAIPHAGSWCSSLGSPPLTPRRASRPPGVKVPRLPRPRGYVGTRGAGTRARAGERAGMEERGKGERRPAAVRHQSVDFQVGMSGVSTGVTPDQTGATCIASS